MLRCELESASVNVLLNIKNIRSQRKNYAIQCLIYNTIIELHILFLD
jgi:hypothetical protein